MKIATFVRLCQITGAIQTKSFVNTSLAREYCSENFSVYLLDWEPYLITPDSKSNLKYNDEPVSYSGWRYTKQNNQTFFIHLNELMEE